MMADVNISSEMQLSLNDLLMELKSLGLKATFKDYSSPTELSEYLLSTSWALINLVHCSALGLNESKNSRDREALLLSENQSLESKLVQLRTQAEAQEKLLAKEKGNTLKIETEQKKLKEKIQKQKCEISELSFRLATQEKNFKHENRKHEEQCEALRKSIRKTIGAGFQSEHKVHIEKLSSCLGSMEMTDRSSNEMLQQSTVLRLKASNCTLISENLMLRDALKSFHNDVSLLLNASGPSQSTGVNDVFPDHIFQLPLVYSMKKVTASRRELISKLSLLIQGSIVVS